MKRILESQIVLLSTLAYLFTFVDGQCLIYIIGDNAFTAYIDGVQVLAQADYTQSFAIEIGNADNRILSINAQNYQGSAGLYVTSNSNLYSNAVTTKCIKSSRLTDAEDDPSVYGVSSYNDVNWPAAYEISSEGLETSPWNNENYAPEIYDFSVAQFARFVWNSNPGYNQNSPYSSVSFSTDGDMSIRCRLQITTTNCNSQSSGSGSSSDSKIETSGDCMNGVIVGGRFCIKLVNNAVTWDMADTTVNLDPDLSLSPVLNDEYQDAIQALMARYEITEAWLGGRMYPNGISLPWTYGDTGSNIPTHEAYQQGCFMPKESVTFPDVTSQLAGILTLERCIAKCQEREDDFALFRANSQCFCSQTMPELDPTGWTNCTFPCPSDNSVDCYSSVNYLVYRANGIDTPWHTGIGQPNNFDPPQYCAAIRSDSLLLDDLQCGGSNVKRFICEIPNSNGGSCSSIGSTFLVNRYSSTRCFYMAQPTEFTSWYMARMRCISVGGDLASPTTPDLYQFLADWIRANPVALNVTHTWINLIREAWYWPTDLSGEQGQHPFTDFNYYNFDQYQLTNQINWKCLHMVCTSTDATYCKWKNGDCASAARPYFTIQPHNANLNPNTDPPTNPPTNPATNAASTTENPATPAAGAATSSQLSTVVIVLIILILLLLLAVIIAIIIFCCCCYKGNNSVVAVGGGPKKYNARPIAHIPISTKLGEEESGIYVVESEQGSTTNLVADKETFGNYYTTPRYDDWAYD